jgi:hypothetical protein
LTGGGDPLFFDHFHSIQNAWAIVDALGGMDASAPRPGHPRRVPVPIERRYTTNRRHSYLGAASQVLPTGVRKGDFPMKKLILIGCALVVVVAAVVFFGLSNLGPIVKKAVNTYGPKVTQTEVRLADVGISLFTGEVKLKEFLLGNPRGFSAPEAMKVESIYLDLDEKSVTADPIVIDKIEVVAPEITYERRGQDDNFNALLRNVKKSAGAAAKGGKDAQSPAGGETGGGKKLLIRSVVIKDGSVNLTAKALAGQRVTAELPFIELKDVGGKREGVTPEKAMELILAAVYQQMRSPDVTAVLGQGLQELGVTVKGISVKGLDDQAKEKVEGVKDAVKGLLGD